MTQNQKYFLFTFRRNTVLFLLLCVSLLLSCKSNETASAGDPKKNSGKGISDKERTQFDVLFFNANKDRILGNYDLAEVEFSQALKIDPNNAATMYELANIYSFQNKKSQALLYSRNAAAIDPKNVWYQLLYASCLKENKMPNEVATVYERLIKLSKYSIIFCIFWKSNN